VSSAVDTQQLRRADGPAYVREFADALNAGERRGDGYGGKLLGRRPLRALQNHVHAVVAVEVFADERAARQGTHNVCNGGAVESGCHDAAVVGDELQLGFGDLQSGYRANLRARDRFVDNRHGLHGDFRQGVDVRALQVDIDRASAVEAEVEQR
jgi:hypothetical protein